jgi:hypothetical protein
LPILVGGRAIFRNALKQINPDDRADLDFPRPTARLYKVADRAVHVRDLATLLSQSSSLNPLSEL